MVDGLNEMRNVLARSLSSGDLTFWLSTIPSAGRLAFATALLSSVEYRTVTVGDFYQRFLRRSADAAGLSFFVQILQQGAAQEQVITTIVGSDEYFQARAGGTPSGYIQAAFSDLLGRSPSTSEVSALSSASRQAIAQTILASAE